MKKILLLVAVGVMFALGAQAQQKIGYINTDELMAAMPEYKQATDEIIAYQKTFVDQGQVMQKELETKYNAYVNTDPKTLTDAVRQVKEKELNDLQLRIRDLEESMNEKVRAKQNDLMKPVFDKVKAAIDNVGKENGYAYILDANAVLFADGKDNVLPMVKAKLGIK
jgi:outer membrane protein